MLAEALDDIAAKRRSPQDLVNRLGKNLPGQLCERLADRGLLRREETKLLGLVPRTRWPAAGTAYKEALRASVRRALVLGEDPDQRTACVIAAVTASTAVAASKS